MHRLRLRALRTWSSGRPATSVTCLSALAARFGRKLRMLREATLFIGHALSALAPGNRRERAILREAALRAGNALPALAPGFCRQSPVLREAALLVRYRLATHARYLPLPLRVHRCEAAVRDTPFMCSLSHHSLLMCAKSEGCRTRDLISTCDAVGRSIPRWPAEENQGVPDAVRRGGSSVAKLLTVYTF